MIVRNITFSADEELIEKARAKAAERNQSLNDEFRSWLARYVASEGEARMPFLEALNQLPTVKLPRKYSRDEMNERR